MLEVVPKFAYVGLTFTQRMSLFSMGREQAVKGKRALISVLLKLHKFCQLTARVFFNIFKTKIVPILLYGAEIWGVHLHNSIESVQIYAYRRYMCVSKSASKSAVFGDCGQHPLRTEYFKNSVKYWLTILNMQETRLVKKYYLMLKLYDESGQKNWVTSVKLLLQKIGFGYVWERQCALNGRMFLLRIFSTFKRSGCARLVSFCSR